MFNESEIQLIKEALKHGNQRIKYENFQKYSDLDDNDVATIWDACEEYLLFCGFDSEYKVNDKGKVLQKILDILSDI